MSDKQRGVMMDLPVEWRISDTLPTLFATNMTVQHTEHEMILAFYEIRPPMIFEVNEEADTHQENIKSVQANCVARIVVSPGRMKNFLDALQKNFDRYESQYGAVK